MQVSFIENNCFRYLIPKISKCFSSKTLVLFSSLMHTWARVKLLAWGYTLEASTFGKGGVGKIFRL